MTYLNGIIDIEVYQDNNLDYRGIHNKRRLL